MTKEMGRPIKEARAEVEKCAWVMDYFADNWKAFINDELPMKIYTVKTTTTKRKAF